ncbi:hypothetical protein C4B63_18g330 [Trypanosoma cruzi]|uniref:C3H1-type domain-containing protein n=1 Tax=Trypanosoma cruzi TaxID=5693 RepID=A0A2V2VJJ6_TRYCR|nr:hypothetical protein C4B63_18g330 [Trypanosoma cruzi]
MGSLGFFFFSNFHLSFFFPLFLLLVCTHTHIYHHHPQWGREWVTEQRKKKVKGQGTKHHGLRAQKIHTEQGEMWKSTSSKTISENSTTHSKNRDTNYSKFRTRVCRNYSMGITCPFGERCAFSHGEPDKSHVRTEEAELPPPPPYPEGVQAEIMLPPAYPSRFRHDPYGPEGFVVVAKELFSVDRIQRNQPLGRLYT